MDHVLRVEVDDHRLAGGQVQGVQFALTARVAGLPHPLLGLDIDLERLLGQALLDQALRCRPPEEEESEEHGGSGPADLELAAME